jgi:hypothetical protein
MLKNGWVALLMGLLVFGSISVPSAALQTTCAMTASSCCCGACHCPVKSDACVSCVREKSDFTVVAVQPVAKPRVAVALYLLPEVKPADVHPLFARAIRGLDPSPPSGGPSPQALLSLWLI